MFQLHITSRMDLAVLQQFISATKDVISPTVLYLVCFALTHPNLSTSLLYVNVSSLASSCESQVFYMTAAGNEAQT